MYQWIDTAFNFVGKWVKVAYLVAIVHLLSTLHKTYGKKKHQYRGHIFSHIMPKMDFHYWKACQTLLSV